MTPRALLVAALVLVAPAAAGAQTAIDPEANAPYLWRVVVKTEPHPLLTPGFRQQLRRDLLAALQPGLGPLGTVEVVTPDDLPRDRWDPFWEQFWARGFAGLDAPRDLTGLKTHFLRVEVRDGVFHLESLQHDGFTGLFSPAVRKLAVREPEMVGRAAGLMLDADFGITGTAEPLPSKKEEEVTVRLRGGQLGPVARFVKQGDVFKVATIKATTRPAPPPTRTVTGKVIAPPPSATPKPAYSAEPKEYTLLRATEPPKDGAVRCQVLARRRPGLPTGGAVAGYRVLRLETVAAPVAVRLVGTDGQPPKPSGAGQVSIRASDTTFTAPADTWENLTLGADNRYRAARPLSNIALLTVSVGSRSERFPVPVLGPDPVKIQFAVSDEDEHRATAERAAQAVYARAADARLAQDACFEAVAKAINARQNKEALDRAVAGARAAEQAEKALTEDVNKLKESAAKYDRAARFLDAAERQAAVLRRANEDLKARLGDLQAVVGQTAQDVEATRLNTQVGVLLSRGDVDDALKVLEQLALLRPDDAGVKARRDKLAAEWKVKDETHAKAREFLLKKWPALGTVQDLHDNLGSLRTAVDTCRKNGDKYTLVKLMTQFSQTAVTLARLEGEIDAATKAGEAAAKNATEVRQVLSQVEKDITEFLKGAG
jgi:hypothetical protein